MRIRRPEVREKKPEMMKAAMSICWTAMACRSSYTTSAFICQISAKSAHFAFLRQSCDFNHAILNAELLDGATCSRTDRLKCNFNGLQQPLCGMEMSAYRQA